jgi:hypothetical protein
LVDSNFSTTTFFFNNNQLYIQKNQDIPVLLHNNQVKIMNISFANQSHVSTPGLIRYNFVMEDSTGSNSKNFYSSTSIR